MCPWWQSPVLTTGTETRLLHWSCRDDRDSTRQGIVWGCAESCWSSRVCRVQASGFDLQPVPVEGIFHCVCQEAWVAKGASPDCTASRVGRRSAASKCTPSRWVRLPLVWWRRGLDYVHWECFCLFFVFVFVWIRPWWCVKICWKGDSATC